MTEDDQPMSSDTTGSQGGEKGSSDVKSLLQPLQFSEPVLSSDGTSSKAPKVHLVNGSEFIENGRKSAWTLDMRKSAGGPKQVQLAQKKYKVAEGQNGSSSNVEGTPLGGEGYGSSWKPRRHGNKIVPASPGGHSSAPNTDDGQTSDEGAGARTSTSLKDFPIRRRSTDQSKRVNRSKSAGDVDEIVKKEKINGKSAWERLRARLGMIQQLSRMRKVDNELKFLTSSTSLPSEVKEPMKKPCYMVHPHGRFRFVWDFIMIFILLYSAFMIPVRVGFGYESVYPEIVIDTYFFCDICLNFLTGRLIFEEGEDPQVDYRQPKVALRYLRTWFIVDLAATLPINLFIEDATFVNELPRLLRIPRILKFIRLFRLLKMARLLRMNVLFHRWSELVSLNPALTRVFKLFGGIVFVAHFLGCFFYFAAYVEDLGPHTWIFKYVWSIYECDVYMPSGGQVLRVYELNLSRGDCIQDLSAEDIQRISLGTVYTMSIYWSFATLSTIGYGDISAVTDVEYCINIIGMGLGVTLCKQLYLAVQILQLNLDAYIIGNISSLLGHIDTQKTMYQGQMRNLNDFLRRKKLPKALRRRIRRYFTHYYMKKSSPVSEEKLLSDITLPGLRHETVHALYADMISRIPFFDDKDPQFVSMTVTKLSSIKCPAGDYILREGEIASEVYFVAKGTINVVDSRTKITYNVLEGGDMFGEVAMLTATRHVVSYKASSDTELFALTREDLFRVLQEFPSLSVLMHHEASEKLRTLRKKLALQNAKNVLPIEDEAKIRRARVVRKRSLSDNFGVQLAVLDELYQKQGDQARRMGSDPTMKQIVEHFESEADQLPCSPTELGGRRGSIDRLIFSGEAPPAVNENGRSNDAERNSSDHVSEESGGRQAKAEEDGGQAATNSPVGNLSRLKSKSVVVVDNEPRPQNVATAALLRRQSYAYVDTPPPPVLSRGETGGDLRVKEVFCPHCGSIAYVRDGQHYLLAE